MKTAIILHGMSNSKEEYLDPNHGAESSRHWVPWLEEQLEQKGIKAQAPEMPEPYAPDYEKWRDVFEKLTIDENTMLIGHSCGAGFLVRWLSEHPKTVDKVVLVAPWLDPNGGNKEIRPGFFNFEIDENLANRAKSLTIFVSKDDDEEIIRSVKLLESKLKNAKIIRVEDKGHFTFDDMGTREFPQLLEVLINY